MKKPMRTYKPSDIYCIKCRGPIVEVEEGFQHIREPQKWHKAVPK